MNIRQMTRCALMTAVIAVLSPLSVPLSTQVPISLATFAVMLGGAVLGAKEGVICTAVYLLLGAIGIPVFAGYTSGIGILVGMTGGYLIGYLPLAYLTGFAAEKNRGTGSLVIGMLGGTAVLYVIGTAWFMAVTKMPLAASLAACVLPFLPGDALKIAVVAVIAPRLRAALNHTAA